MKWYRCLEPVKVLWGIVSDDFTTLVGFLIIIAMIFTAILAPIISPYRPYELGQSPFSPPSMAHLMGSDHLGRDVFSQIIWGARVSLLFALGAAGISLIIGTILGAIAGYYGGIIDDLFSRSFEVFMMIPVFFLLMLVVALYGTKIEFTILLVGLTIWPSNARVMRAQALSLKTREFIDAAKISGGSNLHILLAHIIPNGIYPVIANSTIQMGYAIIIEAGLSFIGLGDPNQMSWGQILHAGQSYLTTAWWLVVFPGIVISILVFTFNVLGDAVNRLLSPKLKTQIHEKRR